jgi:Spy/CpxP family protein refolding chaperone
MKSLTGWKMVALSLAVLCAVASVADAQGQGGGRRGRGGFGGGGFGRGGGMNETMLLGLDQVAKELELADEQKAEIRKISEESMAKARERVAGLRDLSDDERRARFEEMRKEGETAQAEVRKKIEEVLLPEQKERLSQIVLQVQGASALASDEVASKLSLTEDQKTKLREVQEAAREKMQEAFGRRGDGERGQGGGREAMQKLRTESQEQAMAVLTDEQKKKLEELKGKAFELDMSAFGRGGRGGEGGRRGEGRGEGRQRPSSDN